MAQYKAKVSFLADTKDLLKGVSKVERTIGKLGKGLERHSSTFLRAGAAMGGALAGLAAQGIAYGTTIDRMSKMTGVAAEEISRLAYSAELYHGDAAKIEKGVRTLARAMKEAGEGAAEYADEFKLAGIDVMDAGGNLRSLNDVLLDMADYMASGANDTEKLAVATALLGGRQSELVPWLKQGSAAIRANYKEAGQLGQVIDGETAEAMERLGTSVKKVKLAMRGLGVEVAETVAPHIEELSAKLLEVVKRFNELPKPVREAAVKTGGYSAGLLLLGGIAGKVMPIIRSFWSKIGAAADKIVTGPMTPEALFANLTMGAAYVELADTMDSTMRAAMTEKLGTMGADMGEYTGQQWRAAFLAAAAGGMSADDILGAAFGGLPQPPSDWGPEYTGMVPAGGNLTPGGAGGGGEESAADKLARLIAYTDTFTDSTMRNAGAVEDTQRSLMTWAQFSEVAASGIQGMTSTLEGQLPAIDKVLESWEGFGIYISENLMPITQSFFSNMDRFIDEGVEKQMKGWKVLAKGSLGFLREVLSNLAKAKALELAGISITEKGKAVMTGQWWMLPVIAAGYAAAMAGINKLTSFDVGAKVQRGGAFSGNLHTGERIVNLQDFKSLVMAADGGGRGANVTVNMNLYGVQPGTPQMDSEARRIADIIARRVGRA